jgi:MoxR-like ATPase
MTIPHDQAVRFATTFDQLVANVDQAIKGKSHTIRLALTCLLTGGHLLLEDVPGTGKTVLAKSIANTVDGTSSRIQFTPDLLPSDVTGVTIYNQQTERFDFHPGPVFANVVLADEINRASPKTQSSLLEVMEEGRVTVDGVGHETGRPFMVIATMNPVEQAGTYALPEAQLDRFLMKTSLGYPEHQVAVQLLADAANTNRDTAVAPVITAASIVEMGAVAATVHIDLSILEYVNHLAEATRRHPHVALGASMRGCLAFVRAARTWAAAQGRTYVTPEDVKALALPVLGHRLILTPDAQFNGVTTEQVLAQLLSEVAPPAGVTA